MSITKAEIIDIAFTRNVSEDHIKDADITAAVRKFLLPYTKALPAAPWSLAVKRVVAFGVAWLIADRMAVEVSDRGVVSMLNQGAGVASEEAKLKAKNEIMLILINLINDLPNVAQEYEYVGFTGQKKIGSI